MLWSSGISRKSGLLIVRYSQKEMHLFSCCFENSSIAHNFGITGPIQVGFSAKFTFRNEHFQQIQNWNCNLFDFRLISLDCITFLKHTEYSIIWKDQREKVYAKSNCRGSANSVPSGLKRSSSQNGPDVRISYCFKAGYVQHVRNIQKYSTYKSSLSFGVNVLLTCLFRSQTHCPNHIDRQN